MCPWVTLLYVYVIRIHITVTCARNADTAQNKITGILPIREDTVGVCVRCIWVTLTLLRLLAWDTFVTQKYDFQNTICTCNVKSFLQPNVIYMFSVRVQTELHVVTRKIEEMYIFEYPISEMFNIINSCINV